MANVSPPADDKPSGFSGEDYNSIARNAVLGGIQLLHCDMDSSPDHFRESGLKLEFNRELRACQFDADSNSAAAIFRYEVSAKAGRSRAFRCRADYAVLYLVPDGGVESAARAFCSHVGIFAAYPYFRALAAQMAWNAGLELPPLPSIAAMPLLGKKKAEEKPKEDA